MWVSVKGKDEWRNRWRRFPGKVKVTAEELKELHTVAIRRLLLIQDLLQTSDFKSTKKKSPKGSDDQQKLLHFIFSLSNEVSGKKIHACGRAAGVLPNLDCFRLGSVVKPQGPKTNVLKRPGPGTAENRSRSVQEPDSPSQAGVRQHACKERSRGI